MVVTNNRAHPVVYVGRNGVVVLDQPRSPDAASTGVDEDCTFMTARRALTFPLANTSPEGDLACTTGLQVLRVAGKLVAVRCWLTHDEEVRGGCEVFDPVIGGPRVADLVEDQDGTVGAAAASGERVFVGIVHPDEIRALAVDTHAGLVSAGASRIGTPGDSVDFFGDASQIFARVDALSDQEAVFYSGRTGGGIFQAIRIGPTAHRLSAPTHERLPAATPAPIAAQTVRPGHHAPSFVGIARAGASPVAIAGVDATASTFAPSLALRGARGVLSWSEGTGHTTRIRAAVLDLASGALAGPTTDVSTPGREAGYATVDSFGDHTVVAWDEKNGDAWEVHALDLTCTGLGPA